MKKIFKIIVHVVVVAPLITVLLISFVIFLANCFATSDEDLRATISKHASNKEEAIVWLKSTNQNFSDAPLTEPDKRNLRDSAYNLWSTGATYDEVKDATSIIDVSFNTRGKVPGIFYGSHQLRCWLLFNEKGQLVFTRSQSMYL